MTAALNKAVIALHHKSQVSREIVPELREAVRQAEADRGNLISDLVLELAEAVDNGANDIGGSRGERTILGEAYQLACVASLIQGGSQDA